MTGPRVSQDYAVLDIEQPPFQSGGQMAYRVRQVTQVITRPATEAERREFAEHRKACGQCPAVAVLNAAQAEAERAGDAAQRGPVHQGRLPASAARDGRNRMGTRE